jgi:hypothetical protein
LRGGQEILNMQLSTPITRRHITGCTLVISLLGLLGNPLARAADEPVHGLWVWKGPSVVGEASRVAALRNFCSSHGINEVYVSVTTEGVPQLQMQFAKLNELLHRAHVRVEALLSSENADEPGKHRLKLLEHVQAVLQFNQQHGREDRFDGIHLDIEPQQRAQNKGTDNFRFLPGLLETYRAVRALAERSGLMVNADIQRKLLKASVDQRRMLLSSLPRFTLMLYELSNPDDGDTTALKSEKLRNTSGELFDAAYDGLHETHLAKLVIGLRTPDYGPLMPAMLATLDQAYQAQEHYQGWAWHSYGDAGP